VEEWLTQLDLVGYDGPQFFLAQYAQHLALTLTLTLTLNPHPRPHP